MELKWPRVRLFLAAVVYLWAAVPAYAQESGREEDFGALCYMVDFLDYDGSLLDSRLCAYGEKIEETVVPLRREDARYIYRFAGWEPQFSEIVSECAAYTAVYDRIEKSNHGAPGAVSGPDAQESPAALARSAAKDFSPEEIEQASCRSYDVTSFHIEASGEEPDIWERPENAPVVQPSQKPKEKAAGNWTVDSVNAILSEADAARTVTKEGQTSAPCPVENSMDASEPAKTSRRTEKASNNVAQSKKSGKAKAAPSAPEAKESGKAGNAPRTPEPEEFGKAKAAPDASESAKSENAADAPGRAKESGKAKKAPDAPERTETSKIAGKALAGTEPAAQETGKKENPVKRKLSVPILLSAALVCCSGSVWAQKRKKGKVEK